MINKTLFRQSFKSLFKPLIVFTAILAMYFGVIVWMFDPELIESLNQFNTSMPGVMDAFSMSGPIGTLTEFMSTYLYGFLMLLLPLIFVIMAAQRLIVHHVDSGSMAYLLASPVRRMTVALTQAAVLAASLLLLIALAAVMGIGFAEVMFPGELDIGTFLLINLGAFCLQFAIAGLCFLASCIFNESRNALMLAAGITLIEYLLQMLAQMGDKLDELKYATFFTLFNSQDIIEGETYSYIGMIVLFAAGIILFAAAIRIFCRRDLPL